MAEIKIKSNLIYEGKILKLEVDEVKTSLGNLSKREIIRHSGGCGILAIDDLGKFILVRQFRYAYNEELLEIPAGKIELGEDPMTTAKRELEEEIGYQALELKFLGVIYPTCGYSDEKIYLYLATKLKESQCNFDPDEDLKIQRLSYDELCEMIKTNEIKDAKTICALNYYLMQK